MTFKSLPLTSFCLEKSSVRNGYVNFLFDLILYVPSTIFHLCRDRSSWVDPVLS